MLVEACSVILAVVGGPFPGTPSLDLTNAWFDGRISTNLMFPLREEVNRGPGNRNEFSSELINGTSRTLPSADCSQAMRSAKLKLGPWPKARDSRLGPTSPDGQPRITFNPVRVSRDGKHVLVTWLNYWAPLGSSFHYAFLSQTGSTWRIVRDGQFGPVS